MICCYTEANVALGKPAEQYNDLDYGFIWSADKAVDGCLDRNNPDVQACCSASEPQTADEEQYNYWKLNLTREYEVKRIIVYGRTGMFKWTGYSFYTGAFW